MKHKYWHYIILVLLICLAGIGGVLVYRGSNALGDIAQQTIAPTDTSPLGGYNVLIADRGNNRVIEVTPDKKIVWEYDFNLPKMGLGPDDSFFTDNGQTVIVNLEEYQLIQQIDYASKKVFWSYGSAGQIGSADGYLNTPDDAYKLASGNITVADIKNCRILEIAPNKKIVRQYGQTKVCGTTAGLLDEPNGDTPLPNGHMFISTIRDQKLLELDANWQPIFTMKLPVKYPSDPQLTKAGNILVADYSNPGKIVEVARSGKIVWQQNYQSGNLKLNKPSLAIELPNGNILTNDDFNHRVIVINKQTHQIIWQYGTGQPGNGFNQLNVPDGLDIIKRNSSVSVATPTLATAAIPAPPALPLYKVGLALKSKTKLVNTDLRIEGYVLAKSHGYDFFSDENSGQITPNDLPVTGTANLLAGHRYILTGRLLKGGLSASNHNTYNFAVSSAVEQK